MFKVVGRSWRWRVRRIDLEFRVGMKDMDNGGSSVYNNIWNSEYGS